MIDPCPVCNRVLHPGQPQTTTPSFIPGETHTVHVACVEYRCCASHEVDPDEVHETALDAFDDADDWRWDDTIAVSRGAQEDERW